MGLTGDGFEKFGVSALEHLKLCGEQWVTVDEIGYLEAECREYIRALNRLLEQKNVAAVVRKQNTPLLNDLCRREDAFVVDLDDPFGNIGCVIMASGLGKRFGGNKLMADFGGQPMITRILDATEGIFTRRVVVTRSGEAAGLCRARGVETVLHDLPYRSDTVRLGLDALQEVERCMFAAADQPLLTADTVTSLALAAKNGSEFIWRTVFENEPGNPVVFPHWTFQELKNLPEGKGGNVVVKKHPEKLLTVSAGNRFELRDVDCPEDLEELLQVL
ncbi:MAG: NTP transferase domain-containing protein [Clostridia bacterium]|nr:NTP transferase domain-containing protein [Clostridia bacterium]